MYKIFTIIALGVSTPSVLEKPLFNSMDVTAIETTESVKSKSDATIDPGAATSRKALLFGSPTTSITGGILKDLKIILGPNPVIDILTLDFKNQEGGVFDVQVTDGRGSVILSDKISISSGAKHEINLSGFPKGTYILTLRNLSGVWSEKIVKIQ